MKSPNASPTFWLYSASSRVGESIKTYGSLIPRSRDYKAPNEKTGFFNCIGRVFTGVLILVGVLRFKDYNRLSLLDFEMKFYLLLLLNKFYFSPGIPTTSSSEAIKLEEGS